MFFLSFIKKYKNYLGIDGFRASRILSVNKDTMKTLFGAILTYTIILMDWPYLLPIPNYGCEECEECVTVDQTPEILKLIHGNHQLTLF